MEFEGLKFQVLGFHPFNPVVGLSIPSKRG